MAGLLAVAACAPRGATQPDKPEQRTAAASFSPPAAVLAPEEILGAWRIVSVDGVAPRAIGEDAGGTRTPRLTFSATGYGGTSGCNFFGGLGLLEGDRYYTTSGGQTAMGCGDMTAQEDAITGLLHLSPRVSRAGDGGLILNSGRRTMVLRKDRGLAKSFAYERKAEAALLGGTRWNITGIDGQSLPPRSQTDSRPLVFEADTWSGRAACATLGGAWRQEGDRIVLTGPTSTTEQLCPPQEAAVDAALTAVLKARPRVAVGPNGELLIAGGGHWLIGERVRSAAFDDRPRLAGNWRVSEIDGAPPAAGAPPTLAFGMAGYRGSTGCNAIQGLFLAHRGRVFTAPGPQTEQGCGALSGQEARITGLLAGAPRLAFAGDRRMALIDQTGKMVLRRDVGRGPDISPPRARPANGEAFRAEIVSIDGSGQRQRSGDPGGWLSVAGGKWEARLGCSALGGIWRSRGDAVDLFTDARPDPGSNCRGVGAAHHAALMRLMNGRARAIIGVNGELLLAGEDNWLEGQIERPARKGRLRR